MAGDLAGLGPHPLGQPAPLHQPCQTKARIRRLTTKYGVPPASARNLQMVIVQGTMLYATELTWNSGKGMGGKYQAAISRMGRASLGTTPRREERSAQAFERSGKR